MQTSPTEPKPPAAPNKQVGLGPLMHVPKARSPLASRIGGMLLTAVTAVLLATTPLAAQTTGAPLAEASPQAQRAEIKPAARADPQWTHANLKAEQVVVSRFWNDGKISAKVEVAVPWPKGSASIDSASMMLFARDDAVKTRVEDGVLHLSYTSDRGLQPALQGKGVFSLIDVDGQTHLLSVHAPAFTFDDTVIFRQEAENYVSSVENGIVVAERHGAVQMLQDLKEDLKQAQLKLAKFDAGQTFRSVR